MAHVFPILFALGTALSPQTSKTPDWTFSGGVDTYIGFSRPQLGSGSSRYGRQFDTREEQTRLALLEVAISYRKNLPGFGLSITPAFGDNPDIQWQADSTASDLSRFLAEAYLTWRDPKGKVTIDFGKFYSWIGYEGQESWTQDVYSRGILTTTGQPNYHFGLRITDQMTESTSAVLYATEGWNQTVRGASGVSWGATLNWIPRPKVTASLNLIVGREGSDSPNNSGTFGGIGLPNPGVSDTALADFILTYDPSDRLHFGLDAFKCSLAGPSNSGVWYGIELASHYKFNERWAVGLRFETMADSDGLRFGDKSTMQSATISLDYASGPHSLFRLEYRVDQTNIPVFTTKGGPSRDQKTLNFSYVYRF